MGTVAIAGSSSISSSLSPISTAAFVSSPFDTLLLERKCPPSYLEVRSKSVDQNSHLQFLIETTEAPLVSFAKFSTSANSFSNSANGSTSVLLDSTAFVFPYESKIPALKKHLTTVVSETSFQGMDIHLIAWRRSTDLHTSEAELH